MLHFLCFNEQEFSVLLSAFEIDSVVCFEEDNVISFSQEDYDQGLFSLNKRGLINRMKGADTFDISSECKQIFNVIKKSNNMLLLECKDKKIPQYAIYSFERDYVIISPGTRDGEYVRVSGMDEKELIVFIEDSGLLAESYGVDGDEKMGLLPFTDKDYEFFLKEHPIPEDEGLYSYSNVKFRAMNMENGTGEVKETTVVLEQHLQSKMICVSQKKDTVIEPYSLEGVIEEIIRMMED